MKIPFFTPKKIKEYKTKSLIESGFGLVSTAGKFGYVNDKTIAEEALKPFKAYRTAYLGVPMVAVAIDRTVDFVVSPGFHLESKFTGPLNKIQKFIDEMNFDIFLRSIVKDMLVFGDSFIEIIGTKNKVDELKILNPEHMRVIRSETDDIVGYYQDLPKAIKTKENPWKPDQIAHILHNRLADNPYGTSIIDPLLKMSSIKIAMENSMHIILTRKANAPYHVQIGNTEKGYPPTQTDIDTMTNHVQSLTNQTNWVTSDMINIDAVDLKGKVIDIKPYTEHIDRQMMFGLQVPDVLLGSGNISEGLASVQLEAMDRRAKSIQMLISDQLEMKVFPKITGNTSNKVIFKWGQPSKVTETAEVMTYLQMIETGLTPEFKAEIENKLRKLLDIEGEATAADFEDMDAEDESPFQEFKKDRTKTNTKGVKPDQDRAKQRNTNARPK